MESIKHEVHRETALQVPCRDSFCVEVSDDRQHEKRCRRALRASVSRLPDRGLARFRWTSPVTYRTSIFVAADTKDTVPCSACASRASRFNLANDEQIQESIVATGDGLLQCRCCVVAPWHAAPTVAQVPGLHRSPSGACIFVPAQHQG